MELGRLDICYSRQPSLATTDAKKSLCDYFKLDKTLQHHDHEKNESESFITRQKHISFSLSRNSKYITVLGIQQKF